MVPPQDNAVARSPVPGPAAEVALCVLTLYRPFCLARCLAAIAELIVPEDPAVALRVIVVDNDGGRSAGRIVEQVRPTFPWPLDYLIEPDRGIPHSRNRALTAAGDADLIGFIDDDEAPLPGWLVAMLRVWHQTGAAVLMGRSVPRFEQPAPRWLVDGAFFEHPRFTTGEPFPYCYCRTSGVLIDRRALPQRTAVFDTRFRFSGGSDQHLFGRMHRAGHRFVWVDDAVVEETVPPTRANAAWLIRRSYRFGNSGSLILLADGAKTARLARRIVGAVVFTMLGVARLLPALPQGRATGVRILQQVAFGAGLVSGALGVPYHEYRRVHGT
jgi:succinoglycan biosynthesis protein ExoM